MFPEDSLYIYDSKINNVDVAGIGVRGVVSLSSKARLSGSGTYDDVYVVS